MVTITGIFTSMIDILAALSPIGVEPIHFWLTALISFAVIFMLAQAVPALKENRMVALIIAIVVSYFVASSAYATLIISRLFPNVGIALMFILGFMMVIALLSPDSLKEGTTGVKFIVVFVFLLVIWFTYTAVAPELEAAGFISGAGMNISSTDAAIVIVVLVAVGIIYSLVSEKKPGKKSIWEHLAEKKF